MNLIKIAQETFHIEAEALNKAAARLDQNFLNAIDIILSTKGKLIITGVGKSGLVGAKMAATFASTGTSSFFLHPTEALHGDLGMIGKEDTLLAISSSGESEELTKILPHIKRFDIPLIGLTSDKNSSLGRYADVVLDISVEKEACPLGIAPTTSTTLTMALGDALAVALMEYRGFKKEDFASFHPGGTLGKKLFIRIKDLMRVDDLPIIKENTPLKDAIVIMSQGKLGHILIVDNSIHYTKLYDVRKEKSKLAALAEKQETEAKRVALEAKERARLKALQLQKEAEEKEKVRLAALQAQQETEAKKAEMKTKIANLLKLENIEFNVNKSTLTTRSQATVDKLAIILKEYTSINLEIAGHTDSDGSAEYNQKLSQARVDMVKSKLIANTITASRLTAKGYGETQPLVPNTNKANKQRNRRVEINILGE